MVKYTSVGQEVEVIQKLDDGRFLVSGIRFPCDTDEYCGYYPEPDLFMVDKLFDKPPTLKFSEEIEILKLQVQTLKDERRLIQIELRDLAKESKAQMVKLQRHKQLKCLEDFLDGAIIHYVVIERWGAPKILKLEETAAKYGRQGQLRLLSLFGDSKKNLSWGLNNYRDGSGAWTKVIPCKSYEQALDVLQDHINEIAADPETDANYRLIEAAEKYSLHISDEYVQRCEDIAAKGKQAKIEQLEEKLAALKRD